MAKPIAKASISRRERRHQLRKSEIYEIALRLFVERGFDKVTVDEIAEAADVAKGTFFNYFPAKESLLVEYRRSLFDFVHEYGASLEGGSSRDLFKRYFRKLARRIREEGDQYQMLFQEVVSRPHLLSLDRDRHEAAQRYFVRYLEVGVTAGKIAPKWDLELLAESIRDIWTGTSTSWLLQDRSTSLEAQIIRKIDLLFDILETR